MQKTKDNLCHNFFILILCPAENISFDPRINILKNHWVCLNFFVYLSFFLFCLIVCNLSQIYLITMSPRVRNMKTLVFHHISCSRILVIFLIIINYFLSQLITSKCTIFYFLGTVISASTSKKNSSFNISLILRQEDNIFF